MKRLIVGALLAGFAMNAQAADLPVKAPYLKAPAMAAIYDWTGFYIGANAGGSVGRDLTNATANFDVVPPAVTPFTNERTNLSPAGAVGGGQIGYNVQFRNFYDLVLGVEADIQAAGSATVPVSRAAILLLRNSPPRIRKLTGSVLRALAPASQPDRC